MTEDDIRREQQRRAGLGSARIHLGDVRAGYPCETDGCQNGASVYWETNGVSSWHCRECFERACVVFRDCTLYRSDATPAVDYVSDTARHREWRNGQWGTWVHDSEMDPMTNVYRRVRRGDWWWFPDVPASAHAETPRGRLRGLWRALRGKAEWRWW